MNCIIAVCAVWYHCLFIGSLSQEVGISDRGLLWSSYNGRGREKERWIKSWEKINKESTSQNRSTVDILELAWNLMSSFIQASRCQIHKFGVPFYCVQNMYANPPTHILHSYYHWNYKAKSIHSIIMDVNMFVVVTIHRFGLAEASPTLISPMRKSLYLWMYTHYCDEHVNDIILLHTHVCSNNIMSFTCSSQ